MFWIKNSAADWIEYYWHLCYNLLSPKFVILKQSLQREQIICICADICTFPDLHYRHEQTSAPFDKVSIWSKERAERTVPSLGGHCKQANSAIFCSPLWPQTFMQTLRILCTYCADFCTKKCSLEALFWSLGSKAEAPTCGCFEGTSTSLRVPGDAKMVLEWAIKLKNRVINQGRMFSTDIQPCGSS